MMIYWIIVVFLIVMVTIISIIDNSILCIRRYTVTNEKLNKDVKILFLSDMHGMEHGKDNIRLIKKIKEENPDYILVGGDMIKGKVKADFSHVVGFFEKIKEYKIVYGIGNHEYRVKIYTEDYGDRYNRYISELKEIGVVVTENENIELSDDLDVQGFMMDRQYYKRRGGVSLPKEVLLKTIGERKNEKFRVLLAHNPEYFDVYQGEADLILSGHMHGGIMRLPFINGVISTRFKLFPKYAGGRYEKNNSVMIVSRGLGGHTIPVRIFNPTELVAINLKKN